MKNRLLALAGVLALTGVVGTFYATPVLAQIRAALVKNIDERGRAPYTLPIVCNFNSSFQQQQCFANSTPIPANKRFVIEHVSGRENSTTTLREVDLLINGDSIPIPFQFRYQSGLNQDYVGNIPQRAYADAGSVIQLAVSLNGVDTVMFSSVLLTGYLVDLTQ